MASRAKVVNYETYMSESFERLIRQPRPRSQPPNPELTFSPKLQSPGLFHRGTMLKLLGSPRSKDVVSILYEKVTCRNNLNN